MPSGNDLDWQPCQHGQANKLEASTLCYPGHLAGLGLLDAKRISGRKSTPSCWMCLHSQGHRRLLRFRLKQCTALDHINGARLLGSVPDKVTALVGPLRDEEMATALLAKASPPQVLVLSLLFNIPMAILIATHEPSLRSSQSHRRRQAQSQQRL